MSSQPVIAIICDFDGTLGLDTISVLLEQNGIDPEAFWVEIDKMVKKDSWDPPLAYMHKLIALAQDKDIDMSPQTLQKIGTKLRLYPGLPNVFPELKDYVKSHSILKKTKIDLEIYIISGGLEDIIRGTAISQYTTGLFGCNFYYDKANKPTAVKSAITFTEKTRYVFAINKRITPEIARCDPYRVNDAIFPREERPIPFDQMIYVGDGPSDIPCFSLITFYDGIGIGVEFGRDIFKKGYELARGKRTTLGPYSADYNKKTDMRKALETSILKIGLSIIQNQQRKIIKAPNH